VRIHENGPMIIYGHRRPEMHTVIRLADNSIACISGAQSGGSIWALLPKKGSKTRM